MLNRKIFGHLIFTLQTKFWITSKFKLLEIPFILFRSVKDVPDDCVIIYSPTDTKCNDGSWYSKSRRKRHVDEDDHEFCVNVRCIQVMRVLAKFSAKPQAFPYDIQRPYLEFKSKAYPLSLLKELVEIVDSDRLQPKALLHSSYLLWYLST